MGLAIEEQVIVPVQLTIDDGECAGDGACTVDGDGDKVNTRISGDRLATREELAAADSKQARLVAAVRVAGRGATDDSSDRVAAVVA